VEADAIRWTEECLKAAEILFQINKFIEAAFESSFSKLKVIKEIEKCSEAMENLKKANFSKDFSPANELLTKLKKTKEELENIIAFP
jgi:hypothetical protein